MGVCFSLRRKAADRLVSDARFGLGMTSKIDAARHSAGCVDVTVGKSEYLNLVIAADLTVTADRGLAIFPPALGRPLSQY